MPSPEMDGRSPAERMTDAVWEQEFAEGGLGVSRETIERIFDIGLTAFFNEGGRLFGPHEVAALRRSLEWVQTVITATASRQADQRYLETLGLLGWIGEPSDHTS